MKRFLIGLWLSWFVCGCVYAQDLTVKYNEFRKSALQKYSSFRDECNQTYAEFLRNAWEWYEGKNPLPIPKEENPVPPQPYQPIDKNPVSVEPKPVKPIELTPQPKPIEPIRENSLSNDYFNVKFYGVSAKIRLPNSVKNILNGISEDDIANAWEIMSSGVLDNAIRDCLEARILFNLCDWAYIQFLAELAEQFCTDENCATLLTAYLFCQSGYKMRLAKDNGTLVLLFASKQFIYNKPYFIIDAETLYPFKEVSTGLKISNISFKGETPLSMNIGKEQLIGIKTTEPRKISSNRYKDMIASCQVPAEILSFHNTYPTSAENGNHLTRWSIYANTPLSKGTKEKLYADLSKAISGLSKTEAADKLLNWVQTGFEYEYDDKIWGYDRAFFAEETLFYPYCDCEDRSILFSRLVRDLLGLEVALIYYPGHLATAVKFEEDVVGDAMIINGNRYIICDPTYIGAPIGKQMPNLQHNKAEAVILD